jgi:hypothetical protein
MNSRILHALLFCPSPEGFWGLPSLMWSEPGMGKTAMIKAAARATGLPFERLSPAERGEGAWGVVPVPGADGFLHFPPADWTSKFTSGGLIFLDEIQTAPPMIQAPLLGMVQLRVVGSHTLGPRTRVIGAANETRDAAGGWDLAPALANRFGHFDFEGLDSNSWVEGLLGGFGSGETVNPADPMIEEARVIKAWPSADAMSRGLIGGFITRRPELLHRRPEKAAAASSRSWPSRRSVEYAAVALASAQVHGLNEIDTDEMVSGFVGQGWVTEFRTWRANADLPDPADLLDGKVKFQHEERRLDRSLAVLSSCAALVIPEKAANRVARAAKCWELIGQVAKDTADVAIPAARALIHNKVTAQLGQVVGDAAKPVLFKLHPVLTAAGIA